MVKVNLTQLVDDLARLTLVAKMIQEQVELKKAILKERIKFYGKCSYSDYLKNIS